MLRFFDNFIRFFQIIDNFSGHAKICDHEQAQGDFNHKKWRHVSWFEKF